MEKLVKCCGSGWTKEFREMSGKRLASVVLEEMISWGMVYIETDTGLIHLLPALFRMSGSYPEDYTAGGIKSDSK